MHKKVWNKFLKHINVESCRSIDLGIWSTLKDFFRQCRDFWIALSGKSTLWEKRGMTSVITFFRLFLKCEDSAKSAFKLDLATKFLSNKLVHFNVDVFNFLLQIWNKDFLENESNLTNVYLSLLYSLDVLSLISAMNCWINSGIKYRKNHLTCLESKMVARICFVYIR